MSLASIAVLTLAAILTIAAGCYGHDEHGHRRGFVDTMAHFFHVA
jgi:hypothetical protein